jgi:hypothetical protein
MEKVPSFMSAKKQFWSLFYYGSCETICSKHRTFRAAFCEALRCETAGGANHRIVEVIQVRPYSRAKKRGRR